VIPNLWHLEWNNAVEYCSVRATVEATGVSELVMMSLNETEYCNMFGVDTSMVMQYQEPLRRECRISLEMND
jgi:hypothetical protein